MLLFSPKNVSEYQVSPKWQCPPCPLVFRGVVPPGAPTIDEILWLLRDCLIFHLNNKGENWLVAEQFNLRIRAT